MARPLALRAAHWINAFAMACMLMSGWAIYNASPLFGFSFPAWATVGGWLGGSIAWHFAAMWLLVANAAAYLVWGLASGHFGRWLRPPKPAELLHDAVLAAGLRLPHEPGRYNALQRLFYLGVLALGALAVASGLSIWKPVQFELLVDLFGGYDFARRVHFAAMTGIACFVLVHVLMVLLVPRTLMSMIAGWCSRRPEPGR
jgi:thiosulfate reductase cytochrome b subunit